MSEIIINVDGVDHLEFFGVNNSKLSLIKKSFPKLKVTSRGNQLRVVGNKNDIKEFREKINLMLGYIDQYGKINERKISDMLDGDMDSPAKPADHADDILVYGPNGNLVRAKTENQRKLVTMSDENDVLFAVGPAGTGKTYTAVAMAVRALKNKVVRKIILARPAVEAGENLGFLPGDLKEKIDPYLRPLYDALDDMVPYERLQNYMESRVIEIAPLAFMRGRTLDNAFVILDEAQNATKNQLKMFLTRLGPSARCIVTGDLTQIDLPRYQKSGLISALDILNGIDGIGVVRLGNKDVIRHKLVKEIVSAYAKHEDDPETEKADDSKKKSNTNNKEA